MTNCRIGLELETPFIARIAAHCLKIARARRTNIKPRLGLASAIANLADYGAFYWVWHT
jgi:hypothetical protein